MAVVLDRYICPLAATYESTADAREVAKAFVLVDHLHGRLAFFPPMERVLEGRLRLLGWGWIWLALLNLEGEHFLVDGIGAFDVEQLRVLRYGPFVAVGHRLTRSIDR